MAALRMKKKIAAVTGEKQGENARKNSSADIIVPRCHNDYVIQVSKEIEAIVTKKLSQVSSKTESLILGAMSKLDEFHRDSELRVQLGTVPANSLDF